MLQLLRCLLHVQCTVVVVVCVCDEQLHLTSSSLSYITQVKNTLIDSYATYSRFNRKILLW